MAEAPDSIPDDQFVPDDASQSGDTQPQAQASPPDSIPDNEFIPDPPTTNQATGSQQNLPDSIPDDQFQADEDAYTTPEEKGLTAIEGIGRGYTFGLSDALAMGMRKAASALGVPDGDLHYIAPNPQDISNRKNTNNYLSGVSEFAGNMVPYKALTAIGSKAIASAITLGTQAAGDELSKAMLGNGDPAPAVAAHIIGSTAAGLLGGKYLGALGSKIGGGLEDAVANSKIGTAMKSVMVGAGHYFSLPSSEILSLQNSALLPEETSQLSNGWFKTGQMLAKAVPKIGAAELAKHALSNVPYGRDIAFTVAPFLESKIEQLVSPYTSGATAKLLGGPLLKAASSGVVDNWTKVIDHAQLVQNGVKAMNNSVDSIFKAGGNKAVEIMASPKERQKLKDFMANGGIDTSIQDAAQEQQQAAQPQGFAEGGEVDLGLNPGESDPVAKVWPEQNVMLATAKGRVSNYLNSIRPQTIKNKLPYDTDYPDEQKERDYDKTLDLAAKPLSIINHIKDGTLLPKHMQAFTSMYPEVHGELSKKITKRMNEGQLKGEKKPPHQVRQALSLFLGASLDSSLTPQNMAAIQNMYAQAKAQKQPPPSSSSSLSNLGKLAQTPDQARDARFNKS